MPRNLDMPAHPRNDAVEHAGLTKLEYAAVHIAAGIAASGVYSRSQMQTAVPADAAKIARDLFLALAAADS